MFFIGIFGIENKEKKIRDIDNMMCKQCNFESSGKVIKSYDYFHFFFIPLFIWNESYYVICNECSTIYEIPKERGKSIEKGEREDISYWDIKDSYMTDQRKRCSSCRNEVENRFVYCPYCGKKLK